MPGPGDVPGRSVSDSELTAPEAPRRSPSAVPIESAPTSTVSTLRLGVDFGTSTTQVAVYLPGQEPRLLRLEPGSDHMPSYFGIGPDGVKAFGSVAANLPVSVHSIKPLLELDEPIPALDGMRPSHVAFLMLQEIVRRSIEQLHIQRLLPSEIDHLELATNLGCTPLFGLEQRLLLRDVAVAAGLNVNLPALIEEPVAAVYEVMLSGLVTDGRLLIVDMGGGTLDIAVVRISDGAQRFELFASRGYERGGDKFTNVIADRLTSELRQHIPDSVPLTRADETLLWQRAEAAKITLSVRRTVTVDLAGIAGLSEATCDLSQEWFRKSCGNLRVRVHADVTNVYRLARLILDRGGPSDPRPGTVDFEEVEQGRIRRLTEARLDDDGLQHLDKVVLVGGATSMPMITEMFTDIFGDRVIEPEMVGLDRSALVALGLARPKPAETVSLQYPNWGIAALFSPGGDDYGVPLYEPFAPAFSVSRSETAEYAYEVAIPDGGATEVALAFRPVGDGTGTRWPFLPLPSGARTLQFNLDIFGRFELRADTGETIYRDTSAGLLVPWRTVEAERLASWIPPRFDRRTSFDGYDWRADTK